MGFKVIKKRFEKTGFKSAEGIQYFINTSPKKVTNNVEIDLYLQDINAIKPKIKDKKAKK